MKPHKYKAPVLRLVPPAKSRSTIELAEFILQEARAGRIVGLAVVEIHSLFAYSVDAEGLAKRYPTTARGMVRTLDDALSKLQDVR